MKKLIATIIVLATYTLTSHAQFVNPVSIEWKDKVVGKWKYLGVERFGVVDTNNAAKNDTLEINADGSYFKLEDGKPSKGTYTISQAVAAITFKDALGKSKMYYLKKSSADKLILEYQTPDLIRTRYQYTKL